MCPVSWRNSESFVLIWLSTIVKRREFQGQSCKEVKEEAVLLLIFKSLPFFIGYSTIRTQVFRIRAGFSTQTFPHFKLNCASTDLFLCIETNPLNTFSFLHRRNRILVMGKRTLQNTQT